jgi:hypothetical protein
MKTTSLRYVAPTLLAGLFAAQSAYGAACVCIKRSADDRIIGYSCTDTVGEGGAAECQTNCSNAGYPFYSFEPDTNCDKIKKEKIEVTIKPTIPVLTGVGIELNQFQVTTYNESGGTRSYLEQRRTAAARDAGKEAGLLATPQPISYALPITGTAKIVSTIDDFDVPTFLGGGSASTTATNGTLDIKFTASGDPNVLNIVVTGAHTDTANIIVPGGATGDLHGTLNPDFPSVGTLNLQTGLVELLFSQILTSDTYPDLQAKTFSAYYADCGSCVLNGDMTLFEGDSIFLEP